jgi:hypothetical protein
LRDIDPSLLKEDNTAAALFSGDMLIAVIENSNGKWNYGYVYARD